MTFEDFNSYVEWLIDNEEITVQETHAPGHSDKFVTIESVNSSDTAHVVEALISAYDSGFYVGHFDHARYDGTITIRP